jgi:hypothetical protein
LIYQGVSAITIGEMLTGLRFFFNITLYRPEVTEQMHPVRDAQRLSGVLTREEATRLIDAMRADALVAALMTA